MSQDLEVEVINPIEHEEVASEEEEEVDYFEGVVEEEEEVIKRHNCLSDDDLEDLFNKNTESFKCLAQILISRSSLLRHILYHFPPLEDPGIEDAFNFIETEAVYDDIGCEKYKTLCKEAGIVPITRVLNSFPSDTMNLRYYGLSFKQIKAICSTLMLNAHVKYLILEENSMSTEAAFWVGEMLRENNSIQVLNLRLCCIGSEGAKMLMEGLSLNQSVRDLDLSYNELEDAGLESIVSALKENQVLEKLNLSNNQLGDLAGKRLGEYLAENASLDYLNLAWNNLYTLPALKDLCKGLIANQSIKYLNLAWNAISAKEAMGQILKYMKETEVLEHLDLSNNRLADACVRMVRGGILNNTSLQSINLSGNLITADDALMLINCFFIDDTLKLNYMDMKNVFVDRRFVKLLKKVSAMGKSVRIEGVLSDYVIKGPNKAKLLFERCRFLAQKPKKKKMKRDFGHFIYSLPDDFIDKKDFQKLVKKFKLKLDDDLVLSLAEAFSKKGGMANMQQLKTSYLYMYPDTQPPPPPPPGKAKKGGKKGRKDKIVAQTVDTVEKATETTHMMHEEEHEHNRTEEEHVHHEVNVHHQQQQENDIIHHNNEII